MKIYSADFETTTKETCTDETWVWSWGCYELFNDDSNKAFTFGHTIDEFMEFASKGTKTMYFHNLKFDGEFIISWLLSNGFKHNPNKKAEEKTFQTLITSEGLFYNISICFKKKGKRQEICHIYDSYKKLPFSVKVVAETFDLPLKKGSIDYNKVRPKGYLMDFVELDYLHNDVYIIAKALEILFDEGLDKMTIGSDSLNTFKNIIGKRKFEAMYPVLDAKTNAWIRTSYKGGFTYLNPIYAEVIINKGKTYDVNSLYPSCMYNVPLPYDIPLYYEGKYSHNEWYPLYIQRLTCEFEIKEGHIPTIQIKDNPLFKGTEYITSSKDMPVVLTLTSVDLQLFFDHYDVRIYSWDGGYMFKSNVGVFNEYIDKFMKQKVENDDNPGKRTSAKLLLNNLYGKFGTDTDATPKIPDVEYYERTGIVRYKKGDVDSKDSIYTAVASFITSYAREITIRGAQKLGDRFIYADTDSLHITGHEPVTTLDVHPTALGKWKYEGDFTRGYFIRSKTYIEEVCKNEKGKDCTIDEMVKTKLKVTCAGMPDEAKKHVTFDNFRRGAKFNGKLEPKHVKGGIYFVETDFTIKLA